MNSLSEMVAARIAGFERPWMPAGNELRGVVIVVDALGGGAQDAARRQEDDYALLTAGYLYHMLSRAGARTIMLRVDDRPFEGRREHDVAATFGMMDHYAAPVGLRIGVAEGQGAFAAPAIEGRIDPGAASRLAEALAKATNAELCGTGFPAGRASAAPAPSPSPGCPFALAEIRLGREPIAAANERPPALTAREQAAAIFRGIAEYSRAAGLPCTPDDDDPEPKPSPYVRTAENRRELSSLARTIWPDGTLPPEKLGWFCEIYARLGITNRSLVYFRPQATLEGETVVVRGTTNVPAIGDGLLRGLRTVGFSKVDLQLETLPCTERLGGKLYGACRVPTAMTYVRPDERSGPQTQLLYGEPVFLLDRQEDRYLLHASDGYWGWVGVDAIKPMDAPTFEAYTAHPTATVTRDLVLEGRRIPRGAVVPVIEASEKRLTLVAPDGASLPLPEGAVQFDPASARAAAEARVRAAMDLLYTPYVFGGRSPLGLDCSGLVGNVCMRTGLPSARDAAQQAFGGRLVATNWSRSGLRAGDVIFFINAAGKIYHTGIAISPTHVLHSAPPAVQIGCFTEGDRLYDLRLDRDFFMAKRP